MGISFDNGVIIDMGDVKQILSRIQEQILEETEHFPQVNSFNTSDCICIEGKLDEKRLESAWMRVYNANDLYNSSLFDTDEKLTLQNLSPWKVITCSKFEVRGLATIEANRPFDLTTKPLVRCILYHINENTHLLLLVHHRLIADTVSRQLVMNELSKAYKDLSFKPVFLSYKHFIEAEENYQKGLSGKQSKAFWEKQLATYPGPIKLPMKTLEPQPFTGTGKSLNWQTTGIQSAQLTSIVKMGKNPYYLLLSVYAALLCRISGQSSFYIAVPFPYRYQFDDSNLFGPCTSTYPIYVDINLDESFSTLYTQIEQRMIQAKLHQGIHLENSDYLWNNIQDPLRPHSLQVGFTHEPQISFYLDGLGCTPCRIEENSIQRDLELFIWDNSDGWFGYWEYNSASFGEDDIKLWQDFFSRILDSALDCTNKGVDTKLGNIRLIDANIELSLAGADKTLEYPIEGGITALLKKVYSRHSQDTALVYRGKRETYSEFAIKVAKVASLITSLVGTKGRILVMHERSPEMLYAIHGIVHSGNAYVPIGIDWPQARIHDIIDDISPSLILTQKSFQECVINVNCPVLFTEEITSYTTQKDIDFPKIPIGPDDSIYILYTSGTTGRPKGAELLHGGIVNRLLWMQDEYKLKPGDRCLLKTPYTFDVSGWELFWPFLVGATLVISDEGQHKDPREILNLIVKESVRIVHFVPSMLLYFLDQEGLEDANTLTDVVCSGEALTTEQVSRFINKLPCSRLHNLYGPTEASIDVSYWQCSTVDIERGTVPIGRPISNTQIWILDDRMQPCPPLVRGEIFLGGIGIAKGYWNRSELTAERFVNNPFGPGKLYKTGDLGRYGLDGAIEYLERRDGQIKIRGVRIELGEIETHLRNHPEIENAVVKKGKSATDVDCLIAYYISRTRADIPVIELTRALGEKLPDTVIPEFYIRIDSFPQNENGKIDRKSLPDKAPGKTTPVCKPLFEGIEESISEIWKEILGEGFTEETNFFDAGGNSLLLLSLRTRLETEFGITISFIDLFENPSISSLASFLSKENVVLK